MRNSLLISIATLLSAVPAFADGGAAAAGGISNGALYAIGASLAIGLAALGGGIGQGKIGASAMDGIARNPQAQKTMFVPMILGLVFIESLVIYAFVLALMLQAKI